MKELKKKGHKNKITSALTLAGDFLLGEADGEREESIDFLGESLD